MGALLPKVPRAAAYLEGIGVHADVVCVTSADRLYRACRARQGYGDGDPTILDQVFPAARAAPMVTVLDGYPHMLAFLASVNRAPSANLGVTKFGQTPAPFRSSTASTASTPTRSRLLRSTSPNGSSHRPVAGSGVTGAIHALEAAPDADRVANVRGRSAFPFGYESGEESGR
jgi:hypothetical protein